MIKLSAGFFIFIFSVLHLSGQGCSDAGLCTLESVKPVQTEGQSDFANKLSFGLSFGAADYEIAVYGGGLGYTREFGEKWSVDSKITFLSQGGNDIHVVGAGDIFINLNHKVSSKVTVSMGAKIPLMQADRSEDGLPLPMDYQSSLGTLDFLGSISYAANNWFVAIGAQIPLEQNNNQFVADLYPSDSPLSEFQSTNLFQRSADLILRVSRSFQVNESFTITPGLLPIYHLEEDQYTNTDGIVDEVVSIDGSDGLTLNANVFFNYDLKSNNALEFSIGFPFIVREARPDGLTRSFVFGVNYSKEF